MPPDFICQQYSICVGMSKGICMGFRLKAELPAARGRFQTGPPTDGLLVLCKKVTPNPQTLKLSMSGYSLADAS